ncbi:OLC1v1024442C1 [Oldenlandia corymbosa var. corymbosa]|uniref:OLC1v1024442C1 n=1 Tax=Oldenlandia corymbosa var. corymbosa TaxID=529605 RepID=A0AAV1C4U3_OLDCO|nr:OLC1v1024442C1 [Oldenlandia corymbosa var. corymbosa]
MARVIATSEPPSNNAESPLSDFGTYSALHHLSMAAAQRYIEDINGLISTKSPHFRTVVRVMSIWKMYKKADQKEIKSLELIFIDAQGGKNQATIPKSFMDSFINYFEEGCVRQIACFDHALNIVGGYRCSKHEYKIMFESNTIVDTVDAVVDLDIPNHVFEFTPFAEISNFIANFDSYVIGHVIGVSETIIDGEKKRISVELEDERADRLKITLWNGNVNAISAMMADHPVMPVVLIVQYVKCKKWNFTTNMYNGRIFLNDMSMPAISDYKMRLEDIEDKDASVERISILSNISGYNTYEDFVKDASMLTLSEIKELEEPCYVVTFAKITGLVKDFDWCYLGCRDCNKKVTEIGKDTDTRFVGLPKSNQRGKGKKVTNENNGEGIKKFLCSKHGAVSAVAQKFKIQAIVVDGSGSGTRSLLSNKLDELKRKKCLFKLDVSQFNIRNRDSEMSVARVTTDAAIIKQYLQAVSEDLEIDAEASIEFGLNMTQTDDSTAKADVSCTGDVNIMLMLGLLWKILLILPHQRRLNLLRTLRVSNATRTNVSGKSEENSIVMILFAFEFKFPNKNCTTSDEIPLPSTLLIQDEDRSKEILVISNNNEYKVIGLVNKDWTHMRIGGNNCNSPTPNMSWNHINNIKVQMVVPVGLSSCITEDHADNFGYFSNWSLVCGERTYINQISYSPHENATRLVVSGYQWDKLLKDHADMVQHSEFAVFTYTGKMRLIMHFFSKKELNKSLLQKMTASRSP